MEVSVNGVVLPVVEFVLHVVDGHFRLQAERIAAQVDRRVAIAIERKIELLPPGGERVIAVEHRSEVTPIRESHQATHRVSA